MSSVERAGVRPAWGLGWDAHYGFRREGAPGDCHQSPTSQGQLIQLRTRWRMWPIALRERGKAEKRN